MANITSSKRKHTIEDESINEEAIVNKIKKAKISGGDGDDDADDADGEVEKKFEKTKKPKPDPVWYFKPSAPLTTTTIFTTTFYDGLHHVMAVGILLNDFQSTPGGTWIEPPLLEDGTADITKDKEKKAAVKKFLCTDPRTKDIPDASLLRYLEIALGAWSDGDKFMPIRMKAPSMTLISTLFQKPTANAGSEAQAIKITFFRLALIRIFGVGDPVQIKKLASATDLAETTTAIESSFPAEKHSIARTVYGQLLISRDSIPKIVIRCGMLASSLAIKIAGQQEKISFKDVQVAIVTTDIPYMKEYSLLTWLFGCDLASLGYCEEATWEDLADKMGITGEDSGQSNENGGDLAENGGDVEQPEPGKDKGKDKASAKPKGPKKTTIKSAGGSGTHKALNIVAHLAKKKAAQFAEDTSEDNILLFRNEINIKDVLTKKPAFVNECKVVVAKMNEVFRDELEKLGMVGGILPKDMEHFLCKISRMEGRGKFVKEKIGKPSRVPQDKASKAESSKSKKAPTTKQGEPDAEKKGQW